MTAIGNHTQNMIFNKVYIASHQWIIGHKNSIFPCHQCTAHHYNGTEQFWPKDAISKAVHVRKYEVKQQRHTPFFELGKWPSMWPILDMSNNVIRRLF